MRANQVQQLEYPGVLGVYEAILYAPDIQKATMFYRDVLGLALVAQIEVWRSHFRQLGTKIEKDISAEDGSQQLYVRDPAGNSVELVSGELWPQ
jgi:catechol 2,3-dioxygenase-like lactoylglutathione lyase family enzyme